MFCFQCGNQIGDGDRFCEFCGALQDIAPEVTQDAAVQTVYYVQQPQQAVPQYQQVQPQQAAPQYQQVVPGQTVVAQPAVQYQQLQPAPEAQAQKKKKPPIALFIIGGIVLFLALIAIIVVIIIAVIAAKAGKVVKEKVSDYGKTQMESVLNDSGLGGLGSLEDGNDKDSGKTGIEIPGITDDNGGTGNDVQPGDGDIGQFGNNTMTWDSIGRPSLDDFSWYYAGQYDYYDGVNWLDASQYQGAWKGMIIYTADGSEELVNFDINITPQNVTLLADWYMVHIGGNELLPEEDMDDTLFTGYEWGNGIHVETETATIEIDEFWEMGGTQYGKGTLKLAGSGDNVVLLVRP